MTCWAFSIRAEQQHVGFLIRAQHDRWVDDGADKLWSFMGKQAVAGYRDVPVPVHHGEPKRIARVSIHHARVSLNAPCRDPRFTEPMTVWAVNSIEENPPVGVEPIEWMLLTSKAVETFEDACGQVDWSCLRWLIEEWHRVGKTSFRLEASQLKTAEAIERWAALVAITAIPLLTLRDLAQTVMVDRGEDPASPANRPAVLQNLVPRTWLLIVARPAKRDAETLAPRQFWLTIAKREGFIGRKNDGHPGWMTIWRGWYDVMMMVQGAELLGVAEWPKSCG